MKKLKLNIQFFGTSVEEENDVYGLDEGFNRIPVISNDDFAILEYTIPKELLVEHKTNVWTIPSPESTYGIALPKGFTADNTIILSSMWKEDDGVAGNGITRYWTTRNRTYIASDGRNTAIDGLDDVSIDRWDVGEHRLFFTFYFYNNTTNPYPIHLKFLIMKVESDQ